MWASRVSSSWVSETQKLGSPFASIPMTSLVSEEGLDVNWAVDDNVEPVEGGSTLGGGEEAPKKRSKQEEKKRARREELKQERKKTRLAERDEEEKEGDAGEAWQLAPRDFFWSVFCKEKKDLSSLEKATTPPEKSFVFAPAYGKISQDPSTIGSLIRKVINTKKQLHSETIQVLVLCPSAVRSVALIRHARSLKVPVAKLFAKHIKVPEQVAVLAEPHAIGIGTPARVRKLFQLGHLPTPSIVILDMATSAKNFTMLEQYETRTDIFELFHQYLLPGVLSGETRICMA